MRWTKRAATMLLATALVLAPGSGWSQPLPAANGRPPLPIGAGLVSRELVLIAGGVAGVFAGMWAFQAGLRLANRPVTTILAAMRDTAGQPANPFLTAWAMVCTLGGVFLGLEAGKELGNWLFPHQAGNGWAGWTAITGGTGNGAAAGSGGPVAPKP